MMKKIAQPLIISVLLLAMAYSFWFSQPWLQLCYGLALFLFGMKFMSEGLQKAAGDKMRVILDRVTKNRFVAVFFGAIFTAIIQSSGATTVM